MRLASYLIIVFLITNFHSRAQGYSDLNYKYGLDPTLHNGKVYRYSTRGRSFGTQFLKSSEFTNGSVKIKDITYDDLLLNYDVYNQQLVYQYTGSTAGINKIIVSDAWLKSFTIGDSYYELHNLDDNPKIYKVIGGGSYRVMYHYFKELKVDGQVNSRSWRFSSPIRYSYLSIDNKMYKYLNNSSFVRQFSKEEQTTIRKYMREHHVKMKKSSDDKIRELLVFINSNL